MMPPHAITARPPERSSSTTFLRVDAVGCIGGGAALNDSVASCISNDASEPRATSGQIAKCAQSDSGSSLGLIQNSRAPEVMRVPWIPINRASYMYDVVLAALCENPSFHITPKLYQEYLTIGLSTSGTRV
nr:unnamed protein product [Haemonchus contortus]